MAQQFPSMKAKKLLAVLMRKPLSYRIVSQHGTSHRKLRSAKYPPIIFAFHDGSDIPDYIVKDILINQVGLAEQEALNLL